MGRPVWILQEGSDQDVCLLRISLFFHSGTCECFEENVVFFSLVKVNTRQILLYRGTGCIGTNCSLTKCLCAAGREKTEKLGQSKTVVLVR